MKLGSAAFEGGTQIPKRFSGDGQDISPPLKWSEVPHGCREFALTCLDPDAPIQEGKDHPFVHWLIFNISPSITYLPEGVAAQRRIDFPILADQGMNSFGKIGFGGPMPPLGHGTHRYIFTLYALNAEIGLKPASTHSELLYAIEAHVIEKAVLIGTYRRDAALGEDRFMSAPPF